MHVLVSKCMYIYTVDHFQNIVMQYNEAGCRSIHLRHSETCCMYCYIVNLYDFKVSRKKILSKSQEKNIDSSASTLAMQIDSVLYKNKLAHQLNKLLCNS